MTTNRQANTHFTLVSINRKYNTAIPYKWLNSFSTRTRGCTASTGSLGGCREWVPRYYGVQRIWARTQLC